MVNLNEMINIFHNLELDNSSFVIKKLISREDNLLFNYLNEKVNYSSIHYNNLSSESDKILIKTKGDFRHEKSK